MNRWVAGARPRTLPAAVVPVAVGTACVYADAHLHAHTHVGGLGGIIVWRAVAALVVSLALQVATNYSNDYSDGIRGTDEGRVGPVRLVASGLAAPASVKRAAFIAFGVAALAGLGLSLVVGPQLLVVGAASMAAAWLYTGGPRPYGYAGFGEVFVFLFFGVVATVGTAYVQSGHIRHLEVLASLPVGLLAVALLVINNLRDIPGDTRSGKRTLAVRLGDGPTRGLYVGCLALAFVGAAGVAASRVGALAALLALPLAAPPVAKVLRGAAGRSLIAVLGETGRLQLALGLLLTAGLILG